MRQMIRFSLVAAVLVFVLLPGAPSSVPAADKDGIWEAELGKVKDLNEKEPTLVKAVFRDDDGVVMDVEKIFVRWERINSDTGRWVVLSAICTYLKCLLEYDESDQCFHCPCFESVFDLEGHVLRGKAKDDLPDYSDLVEEREIPKSDDKLLVLTREAEE